jgi:hypothetical protein
MPVQLPVQLIVDRLNSLVGMSPAGESRRAEFRPFSAPAESG